MKTYDVLVIGGGAAGMVAAIMAARADAHVAVLEHMEITGKKILATGNGKCNFANRSQGVSNYFGADPAFVLPVFQTCNLEWILNFFQELGIEPKESRGGFYPRCEQASAVADVLRRELNRLNVDVICGCGIRKIHKQDRGYHIETKETNYFSRCCILATGGKSNKASGSDGSGFLYLKELGHHVTPLFPTLIGFHAKETFFPAVAGVRVMAELTLWVGERNCGSEIGELQLTSYGVSGIPVFQLSHPAAEGLLQERKVRFSIDFYPEKSFTELDEMLRKRMHGIPGKGTVHHALIGLFPEKLIDVFLTHAKLQPDWIADTIHAKQCRALVHAIKSLSVTLTQWNKFDQAQVTAGGVDTREINPSTLESKISPGLFFAGEMIDIDGKCGGYNLQWAWASGAVAGIHAAAFSKEFS